MAREDLSVADRDELARRKTAEEAAKAARQSELERREVLRKAQEETAKGTLPPLVQAG